MGITTPGAPCKRGKCYGVEEGCSTNEVCATGCCYNGNCAYYDKDAIPTENPKWGMTNQETTWAPNNSEARTSEDSMSREIERRTGMKTEDSTNSAEPAAEPVSSTYEEVGKSYCLEPKAKWQSGDFFRHNVNNSDTEKSNTTFEACKQKCNEAENCKAIAVSGFENGEDSNKQPASYNCTTYNTCEFSNSGISWTNDGKYKFYKKIQ